MNPGDAAWWWEHGLDGIVGGIVGGLVTAAAVWLTLRHERKLAKDATRAVDLSDLRRLVIDVQAAAISVIYDLEARDTTAAIVTLNRVLLPAEARAWEMGEKELATNLQLFLDSLADVVDPAAMTVLAQHLLAHAYSWLRTREKYEGKPGAVSPREVLKLLTEQPPATDD